MATITEKSKGNKVVSFKFHCCVGRDEQGKQHFRTATWKPPEGLSYAKARKMAEAEAYRWEQTIKGKAEGQGEYTTPLPTPCKAVQAVEEVPEEETFRYFAEQVWMPLKVIAGGARPSTIAMYGFMMRVSLLPMICATLAPRCCWKMARTSRAFRKYWDTQTPPPR